MRSMGAARLGLRGTTMGANCSPGYYELEVLGVKTGQCLPSLSTAVEAAQGGVLSSVGTGVASSPANQAAALQAGQTAAANKFFQYVYAHPYLVGGVAVGLAAFALYGSMSFARGK